MSLPGGVQPGHSTSSRGAALTSTLREEDVERLVCGELWNPHSVLGHHRARDGAVIRAWRPDAEAIRVRVGGTVVSELRQIHPAGLFEGPVDGDPAGYDLEVVYPQGRTYVIKDPYCFPATLGDMDMHLFTEGRHLRVYERLGAHPRVLEGVEGVSFAVWAPNARSVRVVGDFNSWDGRLHPMRSLGATGIWEIFVPGIRAGAHYKFEVFTAAGHLTLKTDPFAFATEAPPDTTCIVTRSDYDFGDEDWMARRAKLDAHASPLSIYEVHLGSWRRTLEGETLSYRDMAGPLAQYCSEMGFTHVELLPVAEHPYSGSWGYQITNYYAATARYGSPDDLRFLIDTLHQHGIGLIVDWVPAHFPKDEWALAKFDGSPLFEHADPRQGEHPDWGTLIFNYGRNEVRNFLVSNALFWVEEFHVDGIRVDGVASMLYLDYSKEDGEWIPNRLGGRENLEAIDFVKEVNTVLHSECPGVLTIAEESTAWPGVSRPVESGGLGFDFKWNMGWMHDTLEYFSQDPVHRKYHHDDLTFSLVYAWDEHFVLPLSHDEVVHGKGSLLDKAPGDKLQRLANLRALLAYMWAHPGKQLLFMGGEFANEQEWTDESSIDWDLLNDPAHSGVQRLVVDLNELYRAHPALWEKDVSPEGFSWIDAKDADSNVISFIRTGSDPTKQLVCIFNFSPVPRPDVRIGLPGTGTFEQILNTDAEEYGGTGMFNIDTVTAEDLPQHGQDYSALFTLPPLGGLWLRTG